MKKAEKRNKTTQTKTFACHSCGEKLNRNVVLFLKQQSDQNDIALNAA
ncbi:hypothetical protein [Desulfobulbus oligotrophicus]|uniref:Uncharacterized protein n=1 Tax=Desulfobulbus oligotrophicus TaxID=1909699 RepID=A0A7T5VDH5_9BACT|nr:hypothetical protein [Desulfobulbus oligotrophicus]QQG65806.1 hypothetical protein HP555_07985 [Desulfobulbus oligotrophicus]